MHLAYFCLLATSLVAAFAKESCIQHFYELEESLLSNPLNLDSLTNGFFPPNEPSVPVVEVFYSITNSTSTGPEDHSLAQESEGVNDTDPNEIASYRYRWSDSPIFLFMDHNVLQSLSLFTIRLRDHSVSLVVGPICEGYTADQVPLPEYLLNMLTVNLKIYASQRKSGGSVPEQRNVQGYSSFYNKSDYGVIGQNTSYQTSLIFLVIGLVALSTFITITIPILLNKKYCTLYKLAQRESTNHLFAIWATVIVFFISIVMMIGMDIIFFFTRPFSSAQGSVWPHYVAIGVLVFLSVLDLALVICVKKQRDFPLPYALKIVCFCTGVCCNGNTIVLQTMAMWVVTTFVHLAGFHLTFIFLAFVASPVQTGSTFLILFAGLLSLISIVTLLLATIQNNFSPEATELRKKRPFHMLIFKSLRLIPFFSLFIFTILFATSYVRVTIRVGDVQSGGIPTLLASIAPAVLLAIMGYIGRHVLVRYVPRRSIAMIPPTVPAGPLDGKAENDDEKQESA